jgi:uncharacterized membrane protein
MMKISFLFHILATVVWVGGMFFAHLCLRPVTVAQLEPPQRLPLWRGVLDRFFPWVWACIVLLAFSGQMIAAEMGGMANVPIYTHIMAFIGYLMTAIFLYIWFLPYRALRKEVDAQHWPAAGNALARIRLLVGVNLTLGLLNIVLIVVLPNLPMATG